MKFDDFMKKAKDKEKYTVVFNTIDECNFLMPENDKIYLIDGVDSLYGYKIYDVTQFTKVLESVGKSITDIQTIWKFTDKNTNFYQKEGTISINFDLINEVAKFNGVSIDLSEDNENIDSDVYAFLKKQMHLPVGDISIWGNEITVDFDELDDIYKKLELVVGREYTLTPMNANHMDFLINNIQWVILNSDYGFDEVPILLNIDIDIIEGELKK